MSYTRISLLTMDILELTNNVGQHRELQTKTVSLLCTWTLLDIFRNKRW